MRVPRRVQVEQMSAQHGDLHGRHSSLTVEHARLLNQHSRLLAQHLQQMDDHAELASTCEELRLQLAGAQVIISTTARPLALLCGFT